MENQSRSYTIIVGKPESGKSRLAKEIAGQTYKENEVAWIDGKSSPSHFRFQNCNENTKLLIIDDAKDVESYIGLTEEVVVERQCKEQIVIHPEIILVCDENVDPNNFGLSITRRFNIIKL